MAEEKREVRVRAREKRKRKVRGRQKVVANVAAVDTVLLVARVRVSEVEKRSAKRKRAKQRSAVLPVVADKRARDAAVKAVCLWEPVPTLKVSMA